MLVFTDDDDGFVRLSDIRMDDGKPIPRSKLEEVRSVLSERADKLRVSKGEILIERDEDDRIAADEDENGQGRFRVDCLGLVLKTVFGDRDGLPKIRQKSLAPIREKYADVQGIFKNNDSLCEDERAIKVFTERASNDRDVAREELENEAHFLALKREAVRMIEHEPSRT